MRRIPRYVLLELLKVFLVALLGMTALLFLVLVVQEAVRQGMGPKPILRMTPYVLPDALRFAVPGTILFAACSVFGRISASNEVTAIKAVGVSPMVMIWPALALAFLVSLVAVWLNDVAVSWGRKGVQRVVLQSVEQIAYGMLRTRRAYTSPKLSINVQRVEGRRLINPTVTFRPEDGSPSIVLNAQEAELRLNPNNNTLGVVMTNGEFEWGDDVQGIFPDREEYEIPLSAAARKGGYQQGPADCALRSIPARIGAQRDVVERMRESLAVDAFLEMATGDFESLTRPAWRNLDARLRLQEMFLTRLHIEPWRRWANGFSCFCFVLVGAPLAIRLRTADVWTSFGVCFLPILCVYYPLLAYGVDRAKSGALPPYSVWLGNLVLLLIGVWTLRRVLRR